MIEIPTGFRLIGEMDEVIGGFAPVYLRSDETGAVMIGFHVRRQHCNPGGNCHGGAWATMADVVMGLNVGVATGLGGPTVSMTLDYMGAARIGQWVEGKARLLRATHKFAFADCFFTADGEPALRANAIFRRKFQPRSIESYMAAI